jgi:hypothetical protein
MVSKMAKVTVKVSVECSNNITLIANQVVICPAVLVLLNLAISQYLQRRERIQSYKMLHP